MDPQTLGAFLSRPSERADVRGTAFDDMGALARALGLRSTQDLTPQPRNSLTDPNAEADAHWRYTPGSPWEMSKGAQRVESVLGAPGVNELLFASNFIAPRPGAAMLPPVTPKTQGIRAYHGSPNSFDKFDMRRAGEGAGQSYGEGLYFAEREDFARRYRGDSGHMYEVKINADRGDFIDFDAPLNKQPLAAQRTLAPYDRPGASMETILGRARSELRDRGVLKKLLSGSGSIEDALLKNGVAGIRHRDLSDPRAYTRPTAASNYVVFDDSIIEILRKYGLAGLMAGGAASQSVPQQD